MDRFPGMGPRMNHLVGVEATMLRVAEHREQAARKVLEGPAG
jgi:hypothetical protein